MIALYAGVIGFITLLFQYVNILLPDVLDYSYFGDGIRQSMASIIVVWPVFLLMSWLIYRDIRQNAKKQETAIRKWLLYLTLLVSSITVIIDLVTLIYQFLGGELTLRFALKVLVVLIAAGGVFGYYVWDIRRRGEKATHIPRTMAVITSVVALGGIVAGFFIAGSPAKQRALRLDESRIQSLSSLQYEITNYWQRKQTLPTSLADLRNELGGYIPPTDPQTEAPFEYRATGDLSFELCATFTTDQQTHPLQSRGVNFPSYVGSSDSEFWKHAAGRTCFSRSIDPTLYPPFENTESIVPKPFAP